MKFARFFASVLVTTAISVFTSAAPTSAVAPPLTELFNKGPQVWTGDGVTCVIELNRPFCAGKNNAGQLGDDTTTGREWLSGMWTATDSTAMTYTNIFYASGGSSHFCFVSSSNAPDPNAVYCFGDNQYGQLGDGTNTFRSRPTKVADNQASGFTNSNVQRVFAGYDTTCAVKSTGSIFKLFCWGRNDQGQVGDGTTTDRNVPTAVVGGGLDSEGVMTDAVSVGRGHTCAIKFGPVGGSDTRSYPLMCWGDNSDGQLGDGSTNDSLVPVFTDITGPQRADYFVAGDDFTCASRSRTRADSTEKMRCWGANDRGQLGTGATGADVTAPQVVPSSGTFVDTEPSTIFGGGSTICTQNVTSGGSATATLYCWGANDSGQAKPSDAGSGNNVLSPYKMPDDPTLGFTNGHAQYSPDIRYMDMGSSITNGFGCYGSFCWGDNSSGQLAQGDTNSRQTMVRLKYAQAQGGGSGGGNGGGGLTPPPSCTIGAPTSSNTAVTFDTSFGSGGSLSMGDSSNDVGPATGTVTRSGQILVAATASLKASPYTGSVRLVRYNVDGSLDTSFGTNGIGGFNVSSTQNIAPSIVTELSDGSIVVAGINNVFGVSTSVAAVVMKFSSNGILDTSFGTNGILTLDSASSPGFVSPGKMISVGDSVLVMYVGSSGSTSTTKIAKISSTGSLDSSFGTSGTLTLSGSGADLADGPSGAFFVAGTSSAATPDATVSKYTSTGSLDASFGTSGVATVDTSTLSETGVSASVVNGKIMVGVKVRTSASGQASSYSANLVRLNADGSVDSGFGTSGAATVYSGTAALVRAKFTSNGTGILTFANSSVVFVAADGTPLAGSATTPINASGGACVASKFDLLPVGSSVFFVATNYPSQSVPKSWVMKASVAGVDLTAGGSTPDSGSPTEAVTPAPTLVTSANAAALVRAPGSQSIIVNGEEVVIESNTVSIPAARTPASQRTAAQVKSIQQAGAALLQQFLASLPAGATSNVTVVNTATGAVMQNLVFDANGNSVNVPVEDIVFLDGPQLSLMIGSDNANITADGKYQVGAGGTVGVTGSGLGVSANGEIIAMSTPTLLANFQTTAAGDFNKSATLPSSISVGDHTLVVATGSTYAMMGIRVVPAALPTTGNSSDRVVIIALFTLVFGALFFRGRRINLI